MKTSNRVINMSRLCRYLRKKVVEQKTKDTFNHVTHNRGTSTLNETDFSCIILWVVKMTTPVVLGKIFFRGTKRGRMKLKFYTLQLCLKLIKVNQNKFPRCHRAQDIDI